MDVRFEIYFMQFELIFVCRQNLKMPSRRLVGRQLLLISLLPGVDRAR